MTSTPDLLEPETDQVVHLRAEWRDFERLLALKGDDPVPRLAFWDGVLEIMSPSYRHERAKSWLGRLIETWAEVVGIDLLPVGSWTLKNKRRKGGAEPDECYVIGPIGDEEPERPHLAIEIVVSSWRMDKVALYAALGVRELWVVRRGAIEIHVLQGEAAPREVMRSELLPALDHTLLLGLLGHTSLLAAKRALREQLGR